jgi:predicted amidophosphoribosyltransferase
MEVNPKPIYGNWAHGWALDQHTLSSRSGGGDRCKYDRFATERSEIGEALYKLKYRLDRQQVVPIARAVAAFIRCRLELADIHAVLAVPPSNLDRAFQPVAALAAAIAAELTLPAPDDYLLKTKPTPALKNMEDTRERREELDGAFAVTDQRFQAMHVLLFDDLFRSGETLKAVTAALLFAGQAGTVSVLTATYTRSKT